MSPQPFVKSADTKTSAANSRAQVERILRRYGAVGFSVAQEYDQNGNTTKILCEFVIPNSLAKGAGKVPVRIPIDVLAVADALFGREKRGDSRSWNEYGMKRAERVAWRNLVLWIDASLSASAIGLQTITDAFLSHMLVATDGGRTVRMADYLEETQGALAPGVRALLASPAETE